MSDAVLGIIILLSGLFTVFCSVKNYDWFMNHRKAWLFVKIFGRNGARVIYILIGLLLVAVSMFLFARMAGIVPERP